MDSLGFLILALPPGVFWLWVFARRSRYRPIPYRKLATTFAFGAIAAIPAGIAELLLLDEAMLVGDVTPRFGDFAVAMLFVVGPAEEAAKFGACWIGAKRSRYWEEPMDGLVHGVAASVGFATLENVLYMIEFGPEVIIVRALISTPAHVAFGVCWAYALGLYILRPDHRHRAGVLLGLGAGALLHGLFNVSVLYAPMLGVLLAAAGFLWSWRRFGWGQLVSPFRYRRNYPLTPCLTCNGLVRVVARYCRHCGAEMQRGGLLVCGHCRRTNRPGASFCAGCGDRLLA